MSLLNEGESYVLQLREHGPMKIKIRRCARNPYGEILFVEGIDEADQLMKMVPWHNVLWIQRKDGDSILEEEWS